MGIHLIIDGYGCKNLSNLDFIRRFISNLPEEIGMKKISEPKLINHKAEKKIDRGITGFVILAESHISIHTFPNRDYISFDIFSCKDFNPRRIIKNIKETFKIKSMKVKILKRDFKK